jgi:8-oxo-dGTP pyrophosphatase MutT (NUDIX family)
MSAVRVGSQPEGADLAAYIARCRLLVEEEIIWGPASRFLCRAYAIEALPPLDLVTSVRCIVLRDGAVLALIRAPDDGGEAHIVPGGRREPGETPKQTMRREVLEETGWELGAARSLGVIVYRHQSPRPPGYPFPYPEFAQIIYTAEAVRHRPEAMVPDEIDGAAVFVPMAEAATLPISAWQREFLALAMGGRSGGKD